MLTHFNTQYPKEFFSQQSDVLVCPVNCRGLLGDRLTGEFLWRFPTHCERFEKIIQENRDWQHPFKIGHIVIIDDGAAVKKIPWVAFLPVASEWGEPPALAAVRLGFETLVTACMTAKDLYSKYLLDPDKHVVKRAMPRIADGVNGLDYATQIYPLFDRYFEHLEMIEVFAYDPDPEIPVHIVQDTRFTYPW